MPYNFALFALISTLFLFGGSREIGCVVSQPVKTSCYEPPHGDFYFMEEIFKDIPNWDGKYQISNLGRVKSMPRIIDLRYGRSTPYNGRILKNNRAKSGYLVVNFSNGANDIYCFTVHSLVAKAFIPNPDNLPEVHHIDHNKENNAAANLMWVTRKTNAIEMAKATTYKKGIENKNTKPVYQIDKNKSLIKKWAWLGECVEFGYNKNSIQASIINGKPYRKTYWTRKNPDEAQV